MSQCGAVYSRYRKVCCQRLTKCERGTSHMARGPRGYWVTWDDETTRRLSPVDARIEELGQISATSFSGMIDKWTKERRKQNVTYEQLYKKA